MSQWPSSYEFPNEDEAANEDEVANDPSDSSRRPHSSWRGVANSTTHRLVVRVCTDGVRQTDIGVNMLICSQNPGIAKKEGRDFLV